MKKHSPNLISNMTCLDTEHLTFEDHYVNIHTHSCQPEITLEFTLVKRHVLQFIAFV